MATRSATHLLSLDDLAVLIDWTPVDEALRTISCVAGSEPAWPPLAVWHDLSDAKLAGALDDRSSFRRFCDLSRTEPTPGRTTFGGFRKAPTAQGLDKPLFDTVIAQLKA